MMGEINDSNKIPEVETNQLGAAQEKGVPDSATAALLAKESEYIKEWRIKSGRQPPGKNGLDHITGLALSGGGIRSATFALGVVQALAHHNLLNKFDYLSTISGGGYIGSALTWLLSEKANSARQDGGNPFQTDKDNFPFGTDKPAPDADRIDNHQQQAMLNYLRTHGYYLNPGAGINIFALLGVVLRGTLLNLIVWIPISMLILLAGFWLPGKIGLLSSIEEPWLKMLLTNIESGAYEWNTAFLGYEFLLRLGAGIILILLIGIVAYSVITWIRRSSMQGMIGSLAWYKARRLAEKLSSVLLPLTVVLFIIGLLPVVTSYLVGLGALALIAGIMMHLREFIKWLSASDKVPLGFILPIGAALFLYGFIALAFQLSYFVWGLSAVWFTFSLIVLVVIPFITGILVNLNYITVHRFYRDRLMESFMPDIPKALANSTGAAEGADEAYLCTFNNKNNPTSPYHLINTNAVLVNSKNPIYNTRGGDNFILSPYYCGSNATGWCPTHEYMEGKMTLATALAISGAAVNPNAGVGGEGVTRNRILSFVLSLLNLRLGYWAHHPISPPANSIPNHFNPGGFYSIGALLGLKGFTENEAFIQLSDGGHFENMAVYELIRRRSSLIVLSDAGADPDFSFSDFQTTVSRIETDFGVRIGFHSDSSPDLVLPTEPSSPVYPPGAKFSAQGYMQATVYYPDKTEGLLVYIKSTLIEQASFKVKGYKAQNPDFPDQSTVDQFFDEVQFEAYRELGFKITDKMINDTNLNITSRL